MQKMAWKNSFIALAMLLAFAGTIAASSAQNQPLSSSAFIAGDDMQPFLLGGGTEGTADQNCTKQTSQSNESNKGILTEIEQYLKQIVDEAMVKLFNAITADGRFQQAVSAILTLYIIVFGLAFMLGMIQLTYGQGLIRLFKIGIIVSVLSPGGWAFFQQYVVRFFRDGSDDIIKFAISQTNGTGGGGGGGGGVFSGLDKIAEQIIRPETIAKVLAAFTTGPYGLAMGGLMLISTVAFIKLIVDALRTYAVSYVVRALLFGLAPFFIVFMLFERTKQTFTVWLNFVLNFSLQPVLLFIMLAFMMDLVDQASKDMLGTEVCWSEFSSTEGSANKLQFWRFAKNGKVDPSEYDWPGQVSCRAEGRSDCKPFPIDIVDILSFVFLIFLAQRFAGVIPNITNSLTNVSISLDQGQKLEQFFRNQNNNAVQSIAKNRGEVNS